MKTWGIKERVLFVALMPAIIIALVLAGYFLVLRYADVEESLVSRGRALARQLAPAAQYGAFSGNRDELRHLADTLIQEPDVTAVVVFDRAGLPLAQSGLTRFTGDPNRLPEGWTGKSGDGETLFFHAKILHRFSQADDPFVLGPGAASPPGRRDDFYPIGSVVLELSRSGLLAKKREMLAVTVIFTLLTLAAGGLLAVRLGRDVLEPIVNLQNAVADIRAGRLDTRVTPHPAGTLRALEEGVNEMVAAMQAGHDRLEQRIAAATAELKEKKEEAERSNLAKSRFLAAASHDLRQPLHALSLFAAELEHETRNGPQQRLARQISAAVGVMSELLEALLDISRLDVASARPLREEFALEPLFERIYAAHSPAAEAKGLRLHLVPTRLWVGSDPRLLERMVGNLVANAIRYTERGGVLVGARRTGKDVRIEVWDTGIGIAPEHQQLVFQEFFQIGNPERDPGKGLGLGLAIVDRMAKRLEHPLSLRSVLGRGSVFAITLPRATPLPISPPEEETKVGNFSARALVISPHDATCDSLCSLLESWGLDTTYMDNVTEAELLLLATPDVVLFDEERTGAAALAARGTGHGVTPAMILLGEAPADMERVLNGTAYARLAKPVRPAKLRALLQHILHARQGETVTP
ncbi:MAG: ATP-binding protein [Pseudomonadota bacterium]